MKTLLIFCSILITFCSQSQQPAKDKSAVETVLNNWHIAAAKGDFDGYFGLMTKDAVFVGTDPGENWKLDAFKAFSKPYFEKGKAWDFTPVERHIYFSGDIAWFDELLDTWMQICRGSGVLKKENGKWKIAHYVLSMTVPNDLTNEVIKIKSEYDKKFLETIPSNKQ